MITAEIKIEEWWNKNRNSLMFSGAIQDLKWNELWDSAKEELTIIYNSARGNNE